MASAVGEGAIRRRSRAGSGSYRPAVRKASPSRIDDVDDYVELMYDDETKVSETAPAEERKRGSSSSSGGGGGGGGGSETAFRVQLPDGDMRSNDGAMEEGLGDGCSVATFFARRRGGGRQKCEHSF